MKENTDVKKERGEGNKSHDLSAPGHDTFAGIVMGYCRERHRGQHLVYDPERWEITDTVTGIRMSLNNAYADYCSADEGHRRDVLSQYTKFFCSTIPEIPARFSEAEARIYPVICNRWRSEAARLADAQDDGARNLYRKLTDNLSIALAYDLPTAVIYLRKDHLQKWNVSEDDLFATAKSNTRKLMLDRVQHGPAMPVDEFAARQGMTASQLWDTVRPLMGQAPKSMQAPDLGRSYVSKVSLEALGFGHIAGYPGLFAASEGDWLCSSRIVVDDWIRVLPVKGDPVAMVTHSGTLLVTGTKDTKSLIGMAQLVRSADGGGHTVSNIPIRLTPDGWKIYQPPRNHPAWDLFESLRSGELLALYPAQQALLLRHPRVGGFVASCFQVGEPNAYLGTFTTWAKDAEPLLPKADWVVFGGVDVERKIAAHLVPPVPWDAVQSIVGHRMEITEYWPPRYRTREFPTEDELARLMKAAEKAGFPIAMPCSRGTQGA